MRNAEKPVIGLEIAIRIIRIGSLPKAEKVREKMARKAKEKGNIEIHLMVKKVIHLCILVWENTVRQIVMGWASQTNIICPTPRKN